jgi:hypothetical protein
MGSGEEDLNEEIICMVKKHLAFSQWAVNDIVSVKSNHITFSIKWHDSEVI